MTVVDDRFVFGRGEHCICLKGRQRANIGDED
jgi:hypothetical protein